MIAYISKGYQNSKELVKLLEKHSSSSSSSTANNHSNLQTLQNFSTAVESEDRCRKVSFTDYSRASAMMTPLLGSQRQTNKLRTAQQLHTSASQQALVMLKSQQLTSNDTSNFTNNHKRMKVQVQVQVQVQPELKGSQISLDRKKRPEQIHVSPLLSQSLEKDLQKSNASSSSTNYNDLPNKQEKDRLAEDEIVNGFPTRGRLPVHQVTELPQTPVMLQFSENRSQLTSRGSTSNKHLSRSAFNVNNSSAVSTINGAPTAPKSRLAGTSSVLGIGQINSGSLTDIAAIQYSDVNGQLANPSMSKGWQQVKRHVTIIQQSSRASVVASPTRRGTLFMKKARASEDMSPMIYRSMSELRSLRIGNDRKFIEDLVVVADDFADRIVREPFANRVRFAEESQSLLKDYLMTLDQSMVYQKVLSSMAKIFRCFKIQDAIFTLSQELNNNLECDQCLVYLKDKYEQTLWTFDPKDPSQRVRFSGKTGLLMQTLVAESPIYVEDVKTDTRFDKDVDAVFMKNPKNLKCIPFKDKNQVIRGVIQVVNYRRSDLMVSEDEILRLLLENISEQLMSIIANEQAVNNNQRILNLMKRSKQMLELKSEERIASFTKQLLKEVFGSSKAELFMIREGQIEVSKNKRYPLDSGVMGEAVVQRRILETPLLSQHGSANFQVDIDTTLPAVSVPVIHRQTQEALAVFQFTQDPFIRANSQPKENVMLLEMLDYFAYLLAHQIFICRRDCPNNLMSAV